MNSLERFTEARTDLLTALEMLNKLASERADHSLAQRCLGYKDKLASQRFNLAVLGEFKRGKSTLVNALIKAEILPAAVIPLTSVTTTLRYGDTISTTVHFRDDTKVERDLAIDIAQLSQYVTERGNPKNIKGVKAVTVTYPSNLLEAGVEIIDTPGVNSANEHNTKTTSDFLPEIDAAIFLLSADQPATSAEIVFLQEVRCFAPRIFLAQNKIDHLSTDELEQSLTYLRQAIECDSIYPISAKLALKRRMGKDAPDSDALIADGVDELENDIRHFLSTEKGKITIQNAARRLKGETDSITALIELEQHARKQPAADLEAAIAAFNNAVAQIKQEQSDTEFIVKGETTKLLNVIETNLNDFAAAHKASLVEKIDTAFVELKDLGKTELISSLRQTLMSELSAIFEDWKVREEDTVKASFASITARSVKRANEIVEQIRAAARQHLGIAASGHFEIEPLTSDSRHRYAVDDPFTLAGESLPLILPAALAKPIIRQRFIDAAANELSRNSGRLRADFQERINKTTASFLMNFRRQIESCTLEVRATTERALSRRQEHGEESESIEKRLNAQSNTIAAIDELVGHWLEHPERN